MNKRVLVVEDEPDILLAARLLLQSAGYSVLEAENGEVGVRLAEEAEPDAMMLDLRMPGMDGWAVLDQLRVSGRLESLPVIVLSAHASKTTVERAIELGARGYVRKPFDLSDLTQALETVLAQNRGFEDS